jgi:hypothetical protein
VTSTGCPCNCSRIFVSIASGVDMTPLLFQPRMLIAQAFGQAS